MTRSRARFWAIRLRWAMRLSGIFVIAAMLAARPAHAQLDVKLTAQDPKKKNDKKVDKSDSKNTGAAGADPAPWFQAVILGAIPGVASEQIELRQEDVDPPVSITAEKVKTYTESDDRMAMVVLVQGDERWMGNETYRDDDDPDRQEGAYTGIGPALDALGKAGPPGSRAGLMIYTSGKAEMKQDIGDATQLSASSLGSQKDYEGNLNIPLLVGLDESLTVFDNQPGLRKILVVIGDGTGQEEDISEGLKDRIDKLKKRDVEVFTIHYESIPSPSPVGQNNMKRLGYTGSKHASSRENFQTFANNFVETIGARYYVNFAGCTDAKPPVCFTHDGQIHEFVVTVGDEESDVLEVVTKVWKAPKVEEGGSLWWLWLLLGGLGIGIVAAVLVVRARGQEPMPVPLPMPQLAPDVGPAKTVMLNAAGSDGGLPIVGWIVPVSGPNQYQTFKLLQGVTKIGTGAECNVIIQDTFMSATHAEIVCSPTGFVLRDGGSTNGTYVNEHRVANHDLVDNDLLTMGKTSFKFKSIN